MRLPEAAPAGRGGGGPSHRALVIGAASFLAAGAIIAAALGAVLDDDPRRAAGPTTGTTTTTTQPTTETTAEPPPTTVADDGFALNDQGFALMQQGNYVAARPLLERSVRALSGSGELYEAYASYNLAYTRFALGVCDGVLSLLDRSEAVQGEREAINQLYRDVYYTCVGGGDGDDD